MLVRQTWAEVRQSAWALTETTGQVKRKDCGQPLLGDSGERAMDCPLSCPHSDSSRCVTVRPFTSCLV